MGQSSIGQVWSGLVGSVGSGQGCANSQILYQPIVNIVLKINKYVQKFQILYLGYSMSHFETDFSKMCGNDPLEIPTIQRQNKHRKKN